MAVLVNAFDLENNKMIMNDKKLQALKHLEEMRHEFNGKLRKIVQDIAIDQFGEIAKDADKLEASGVLLKVHSSEPFIFSFEKNGKPCSPVYRQHAIPELNNLIRSFIEATNEFKDKHLRPKRNGLRAIHTDN